jgi:hypothetical protein
MAPASIFACGSPRNVHRRVEVDSRLRKHIGKCLADRLRRLACCRLALRTLGTAPIRVRVLTCADNKLISGDLELFSIAFRRGRGLARESVPPLRRCSAEIA